MSKKFDEKTIRGHPTYSKINSIKDFNILQFNPKITKFSKHFGIIRHLKFTHQIRFFDSFTFTYTQRSVSGFLLNPPPKKKSLNAMAPIPLRSQGSSYVELIGINFDFNSTTYLSINYRLSLSELLARQWLLSYIIRLDIQITQRQSQPQSLTLGESMILLAREQVTFTNILQYNCCPFAVVLLR